jgi:uncharacterized repeat protein (TIGR01451 family)/MYXO-CTERM domain-containing protein
MKKSILLSTATLAALSLWAPLSARAEQKLRVQVDQRGDFTMVGNTLGWDCDAMAQLPVVGTFSGVAGPNNCGNATDDSAPDLFWRSDDPSAGRATASPMTGAAMARSAAMLALPQGAVVTHAYLYWGARRSGNGADTTAIIERPGTFTQTVDAVSSYTLGGLLVDPDLIYQSVADVTALVRTHGPGAYHVSGVDSVPVADRYEEVLFAGWALVVFYQLDSDPPRNLAVFDGFDSVELFQSSAVTLAGFLVPPAGFDAKFGAIAYEGDDTFDGDSLRFGVAPLNDSNRLSDAQNPITNFFNGTRSKLGMPVSLDGDLPRLSGTPRTMAGVDLDVVDVTSRVTGGQRSVNLEAVTLLDVYYLGAFVTSVSTFRPDFITSTKTVKDVNGGAIKAGEQLEYTISVRNTGNDASANTVVTDPLPQGVTFVPGSIQIVTGPNMGAKTDAAGDDQATYDAAMRTVTVRIGTGANATQGGGLMVSETSDFSFRVTVDMGTTGTISNQGSITATGARGAAAATTLTDGNADGPGNPPTDITTGTCTADAQCKGATPVCDPKTGTCVGCTMDSQCTGAEKKCDLATNTCVCAGAPRSCIDTDGDGLSDPDEGTIGTDPNDADSDDDGVRDGKEPMPGVDSDKDGKVNALDPDSDNDGIFDGTELGQGCADPATDRSKMQCTPDGDSGQTVTDPLDPDTDDGGAKDGEEDADHDGVIDPGERNPTAGHGNDDRGLDTDNDGLSDGDEIDHGSDPMDADTDDDGIRDGDEPRWSEDSDGDGKINVLDPDSDNDGIFDGTEEGYDCEDPATDKSQLHCRADADMRKTTTDPIVADSDGGGVSDGEEDKNQNGAIDEGETDPKLKCDDQGVLFCDQSLKSLTGGPAGCSVASGERGSAAFAGLFALFALGWLSRRRRALGGG